MENVINNDETDLTQYIKYSILKIKEYLNIDTEILLSSEIKKDDLLRAQKRIIEINKQLHSSVYINAIGGQELYNYEDFKKEGIELKFIKMKDIEYKQFDNVFIPNLSMIDVLMFNSKNQIQIMLNNYELI